MKYKIKRFFICGAICISCMSTVLAQASNLSINNSKTTYISGNNVNLPKLDSKMTYDKVLDIYEDYFQNSIRFNNNQADITGEEWFNDIETVGINRERAKTQFIPYQDAEIAFNAEKTVMDNVDAEASNYYKKLSGTEWDFALVENPEEAKKKDKEWLAKDYSSDNFQKEYVPAAWQTYRNEDGTFKYDEPMYTNHGFPWEKNFENEDYIDPQAPTKYNPVGYYRTSFTLDDDWKDREIFISLQSVESAYYLYVNGKPVGYSTDSFTAHDFNITPYLQSGKNTIALKVFRWSIGSWLENQDFIRQSGIYRDVYLYSKGEAEIRDYFIKTDFINKEDLVNSDVNLELETVVRGLRNSGTKNYKISTRLLDKNRKEISSAKDVSVKIEDAKNKTPEQKLKDVGTTITSTMTIKNPDKWFPDTPNIYYLEIVLKDDNGKVIESTVETVGFRDIRKVNTPTKNSEGKYLEQIQINGKQMVLRGVNRHDADIEKGHAVGYEEYLTDLTTMKQHNLNAIRTSHYPNDSIMYDLADELGLYICMDANIESHRAAFTGDKVPTGDGEDKKWVAPVLDRNATMIERYKNRPSVVIWSSNNEAQYVKVNYNNHSCFWVASMYALKRDPSRLRKSERASAYQEQIQEGDPWSTESRVKNIVDLHSTQYALPGGVNSYQNVQPYVHSEYNHAMGQSYGNSKEHWDVIRERDNVNGGFIWDYIDQAIRTVNKKDKTDEFWGYGGDWIDTKMNDNAFCGNGLVYADHTPSPKIKEAKKVHQQVNFYMENMNVAPTDTLTVKMVNEYENTPLSEFYITWSIYKNSDSSKPLASKKINSTLGPVKGQSLNNNFENISIDLSKVLTNFKPVAGEDYFLDFSVKLKKDVNWKAKAGFEVAHEQFELKFTDKADQPTMDIEKIPNFSSVEEDEKTVKLTGVANQNQPFEIVLNKQNGTIDSYKLSNKVIIKSGPEQSIYRAQTYNDTSAYWDKDTQNAGATNNLTDIKVKIDKDSAKNKVTMSMTANMKVDANAVMTYEIYGNGEIIVLDQFNPKSDFANDGGLAKVGSRMIINSDYNNFKYYGRGPWDTYVDRENAARIGVYSNKVSDSFDKKMLKPQENGNHTDVRWTSLTNDNGIGLLVSTNDKIETSALPYTAEELNSKDYNTSEYRHSNKVPMREDTIVWNIDYKQRGVSDTAFMGHKPLDGYQVPTNQGYSYSYRITPITKNSDINKITNEKYSIKSSVNPVTKISVNGQPLQDFSPIKNEYEIEIPNDVSNINVTAEGTNIKIVDNRNGIFKIIGGNSSESKEYTLKVFRSAEELSKEQLSNIKVYNQYASNPANMLIDFKDNTFWEIDWSAYDKYSEDKRYLALELKSPMLVSGLKYLPRQDGSKNLNGSIKEYEVYVSEKSISELFNKNNLQKDITSKDWLKVSEGKWEKNSNWKIAQFNNIKQVKTIFILAKGTYGDNEDALVSGAELRVTKGYNTTDVKVTLPKIAPIINDKAEPVPTVTIGNKSLIDGIDFDVTYENNTKTGNTATAIIKFKGIYTGKDIKMQFTVGKNQINMRTIYFNTDGGTKIQDMQIEDSTLLNVNNITNPTKEGYTFAGWWNYNFTQAFDFNQPIVQDQTLYAKWNKNN